MELSPAAAAASSLIRSGVSLTGIYREHCRVVAELEEAKDENKRIETYFRELVEVFTCIYVLGNKIDLANCPMI